MNTKSRVNPWLFFLAAALLVALQVVPRVIWDSPTSDEPLEISNGYYYWKGDVLTHNRHPPVSEALQALPSLWMGFTPQADPSWDGMERSFYFFSIAAGERKDRLLLSARLMTLCMALALGFLLFIVSRRMRPSSVPWVMAFWAFEPNLLAFSGYAMSDLPLALFIFAAVVVFRRSQNSQVPWLPIVTGALTGFASCTKFSGLVLIPVFLLLDVWGFFTSGAKSWLARCLKHWCMGALGFVAVLELVYLPGWWNTPGGHPWDSFHYFYLGFKDMANYSHAHHPTYFWGIASRQNHWLYFPAAFILKTTIPCLLLMLLGGWLWKKGAIRIPAWLWLPPVCVFASILPVQNLGLRYLLPVYPFLLIGIGFAASRMWGTVGPLKRSARWVVGGLLAWNIASVAFSFPFYTSYFNDFVPQEKKSFYLGDSNLDIGQDLRRLAFKSKKEGWPSVRLATSIGVDPAIYGMSWDWWTEKDLQAPQPGRVYAMNVSFLQLTPVFHPETLAIAQSWVTRVPPTDRIGDTWWIWVIPGKEETDNSRALMSAPGLYRYWKLRPLSWPGPKS
jgi:hypothetical protein